MFPLSVLLTAPLARRSLGCMERGKASAAPVMGSATVIRLNDLAEQHFERAVACLEVAAGEEPRTATILRRFALVLIQRGLAGR